MKISTTFALLTVLLAAPLTCFGQQFQTGTQNTKWCDPIGTWFGGGEETIATPYQMTIVPVGFGRYAVRFQQAIDYAANKINGVTDWTGEMTIGAGFKYNVHIVAFFVSADGTLEQDAVQSTMRFGDNCNVLQHTIDTYIVYVPWTVDKVPFATVPDVNVLDLIGQTTLSETYHRMPTTCSGCPFTGISKPSAAVNADAVRSRKR